MTTSSDPSVHREQQRLIIQHVERLLDDERLRVDTTLGRRVVTGLIRDVTRGDRAVELKRLMSEMGLPDRELESRMPVGESMEVVLSQKRWWVFKGMVGRIDVRCVSPARALLAEEAPKSLDVAEVNKMLTEIGPSRLGVPTTLVLVSTSGFTIEAHALAERRADRTLILVEPNEAGGWSVFGPPQTQALTELFDPEAEEEKRRRIRQCIEDASADLLGGGVASDRVAAKTQLPVQMIENELKSYARENPGLAAKRLDGRMVLFRESAAPSALGLGMAGGSDMPFLERVKSLFSRKGENEKKIAFLAERRTALSQQRDRAYEEMAALDGRESEFKEQFKASSSGLAKRRITSQLLQLRKEAERRQQLMGVLNQQINVVSTHLHNLELVQQGQSAKLPDAEEMAQDAAAAEEMVAQLEADNELAASVGGIASSAALSDEEQALYEELEREAGEPAPAQVTLETVEPEPQKTSLPPREEKKTPAPERPSEAEPG